MSQESGSGFVIVRAHRVQQSFDPFGKFPKVEPPCQTFRVRKDERLLQCLLAGKEGDDVLLAELIRTLQPRVWSLCSALGAPGDPADLTQETFLRMMGALRTFRGESSVETWVLAIARRVCADHIRNVRRKRRLVERLKSVADTPVSFPAERGIVEDLLLGVNVERREAFVLTQLVGLSYEDAAQIVGCPLGTIRSRVARAREDLLEIHLRNEAV
ncbi:MAG: sigma-70 family RNA polymerase sigma factor [Actinobacteria bacterium]|nr:sigma-70 family RNA polymerase sigma factor [Actinomycetota bacterium]